MPWIVFRTLPPDEVILLQSLLKRAEVDSELLRGTGPIASVLSERVHDRLPLDIPEQHRPRRPLVRGREVVGLYDAVAQNCDPLHRTMMLAVSSGSSTTVRPTAAPGPRNACKARIHDWS